MSDQPSYASPVQPMVVSRTSGKAITSLVLGLLLCIPLLSSLLAVLFAIGGIRATRDPYVRGRGMAVSGLVLGLCGTVFWLGIGGVIAFLFIATRAPRAVLNDFTRDLASDNIPAAAAFCDATFSTSNLVVLNASMAPFGSYVGEICTSATLRGSYCEIHGILRFTRGRTHIYHAFLRKSGVDWKIYSFRFL